MLEINCAGFIVRRYKTHDILRILCLIIFISRKILGILVIIMFHCHIFASGSCDALGVIIYIISVKSTGIQFITRKIIECDRVWQCLCLCLCSIFCSLLTRHKHRTFTVFFLNFISTCHRNIVVCKIGIKNRSYDRLLLIEMEKSAIVIHTVYRVCITVVTISNSLKWIYLFIRCLCIRFCSITILTATASGKD